MGFGVRPPGPDGSTNWDTLAQEPHSPSPQPGRRNGNSGPWACCLGSEDLWERLAVSSRLIVMRTGLAQQSTADTDPADSQRSAERAS